MMSVIKNGQVTEQRDYNEVSGTLLFKYFVRAAQRPGCGFCGDFVGRSMSIASDGK